MSRLWQQAGRYELKYIIPASWRNTIIDLISPFAEADPQASDIGHGRQGYRVHSLYFDTSRLSDYFERLTGAKVRNRLRVRTYDSPEAARPVFLENKRKCGRMVIKHRFNLCNALQWLECNEPHPWLDLYNPAAGVKDFSASVFHQLVDGGQRQPVSVVRYEREAFVPRFSNPGRVRLTLDHNVRAMTSPNLFAHDLFAPSQIRLIPPEWLVMELKFERFPPAWMHTLRQELGIHAVPVSKFGLSVARCIRGAYPRELRALTPQPLLARISNQLPAADREEECAS